MGKSARPVTNVHADSFLLNARCVRVLSLDLAVLEVCSVNTAGLAKSSQLVQLRASVDGAAACTPCTRLVWARSRLHALGNDTLLDSASHASKKQESAHFTLCHHKEPEKLVAPHKMTSEFHKQQDTCSKKETNSRGKSKTSSEAEDEIGFASKRPFQVVGSKKWPTLGRSHDKTGLKKVASDAPRISRGSSISKVLKLMPPGLVSLLRSTVRLRRCAHASTKTCLRAFSVIPKTSHKADKNADQRRDDDDMRPSESHHGQENQITNDLKAPHVSCLEGSYPSRMTVNVIDEDVVELSLNGQTYSLPHSWYEKFRHNCPCPMCAQKVGGSIGWQSLQDPCEVFEGSSIKNVEVEGASVCYEWTDSKGRKHEAILSKKWLQENLSERTIQDPTPYAERVRKEAKSTPGLGIEYRSPVKFVWSKLLESDRALFKWMRAINEDGMAIVDDAPVEPYTLDKLATRVGKVHETIYGYFQDVKAKRNPTNVAFGSACLQLHQDVAYYESMPGLQMLHCLKQDDDLKGGESTFMDGIQIATAMRERFPDDFRVLTQTSAAFLSSVVPAPPNVSASIDTNTYRMSYMRPHIVVNENDDIVSLTWSPNFEAPFPGDPKSAAEYFQARHRFAWLVRELTNEAQIWTKLRPGQVVVFNNRRMFHGRMAFEDCDESKKTSIGNEDETSRHLQLVYVNIDDYWNQLNRLASVYGTRADLKRVFNGDRVKSSN
eukprot:jgi/Bigna1/90553/estExt_fgenesh1_pg.C_730032